MKEAPLPGRGTARCNSCEVEGISFAMIEQTLSEDKENNIQSSKWMCWNCAHDRDLTDGTSLEGFLIWCACCNEPIFWDASNRCHECMVPQDPDEGYCDSCWNDTNDDWDGKYDLNGKESKESFAEIHKNCY